MTVSSISSKSTAAIQMMVGMSNQLDDLRRQLGTGQLSTNYAGLGLGRGLSVSLRSQLTAISAYDQSITTTQTRLSIAQTALSSLDDANHTVKSAALASAYVINQQGRTTDQFTARNELDQMLALLNTQVGDQYIFSGKAADKSSVASLDDIMNGVGSRLGLMDVTAERKRADLGSDGLGRLVIPPTDAAKITGSGAAVAPDSPGVMTGSSNLSSPFRSAGGSIVIDGKTVTIAPNSDAQAIAKSINDADAGVTASIDTNNHLVITGNDAVHPVAIAASSPASGNVLGEVGITAGTASPTNLITQGAVADPSTLTLQVGSNPALTVTFGAGGVQTLEQLATALQGLSGGQATVDPATGNVSVTGLNNTDSITIGGSVTPATFGLPAGPVAPSAGTTVSLSEDAVSSPFGFKLSSISSNLTGVTVSQPSGLPKTMSVDVTANPKPGESMTIALQLPDGTIEKLQLAATDASPPLDGQFTIGATPADTAANLQALITTTVGTSARTSLTAASAITASNSFFTDSPPMRVNGSPPESATSLTAGTSANTVFWYTGEDDGTPARSTATGRIDSAIIVNYGMRANEQGIASTIANVAAFAAMSFTESDTDGQARYTALSQRVSTGLSGGQGQQTIMNISAEIAGAQTTMKSATDRHQQTSGALQDLLQGITQAPIEEVASKILTLQTRLQASYQTTAMLAQTSLVNFL
jgi:flagellar hook-associated protein 3 FlgL